MKPEDFEIFSSLVKYRSGLILTREKAYLLESRLLPLVRRYGLATLEDLAHLLRSKRDEALMEAIAEAMTTNETWFFRDQKPFIVFQKTLLPQMLASRVATRHIRIWSAGCSSGQEAYSLAILCCEEEAKLKGYKIDIIATDLSVEMIERAKEGSYSQFEMQRGLPITMLVKYFKQLAKDRWQINERLRNMIQFRAGNLLSDFGGIGICDIVLCRNVLNYFDAPTKMRVLEAMSDVMAPDGSLILGSTETVIGHSDKFKSAGDGDSRFFLESMAAAQKNG